MAKKLPQQMQGALRHQHYSYRTEETYLNWARRYILYHQNDIRTVLELLGRKACPEPAEGHVLQRGGLAVKSPLDP